MIAGVPEYVFLHASARWLGLVLLHRPVNEENNCPSVPVHRKKKPPGWKCKSRDAFIQAHCFRSWCMNDSVWPSQILNAFLSSKEWFVLTPSSRQGLARPIRPYECQAPRIVQPGHLWTWRWFFGHKSFPPIYLVWRWFWGVAGNICLVKQHTTRKKQRPNLAGAMPSCTWYIFCVDAFWTIRSCMFGALEKMQLTCLVSWITCLHRLPWSFESQNGSSSRRVQMILLYVQAHVIGVSLRVIRHVHMYLANMHT